MSERPIQSFAFHHFIFTVLHLVRHFFFKVMLNMLFSIEKLIEIYHENNKIHL